MTAPSHAGATASPGVGALASRRLALDGVPRVRVSSSEFEDGTALPTRATVDGDGVPPALAWEDLSPEPQSYALICEDPDAPRATPFVHWLVYGIPGHIHALDANVSQFRQGLNDRQQIGFAPAAPPPGHGIHHYHFQLFALDIALTIPDGRDYERLAAALSGHVVAWGELVGAYQRPR